MVFAPINSVTFPSCQLHKNSEKLDNPSATQAAGILSLKGYEQVDKLFWYLHNLSKRELKFQTQFIRLQFGSFHLPPPSTYALLE